MEEQEWQPVQLAPASNFKLMVRKSDRHELWEKAQGVVIHVRRTDRIPIPNTCKDDCEFFEVAESDLPKLGVDRPTLLCLHQILAD
jgi:hypothetical protein